MPLLSALHPARLITSNINIKHHELYGLKKKMHSANKNKIIMYYVTVNDKHAV